MGLFDKLFGGGKKVGSKEHMESRGLHMPDLNLPVDEKFTINFKKNGGKFLYCDSFEEIVETLQHIIKENNWQEQPFLILNPALEKKFAKQRIKFTENPSESEIFFTTCEHLIGQNGSILVCSHQLKEKKLNELPDNLIVFATTSQLVDSIGEGLRNIKNKYKNSIPANITTIKHFMPTIANKEDFLTYGSSCKNLYLLLQEDL